MDKAFIQEAFGGTMPPIVISHPSSSYVQPRTEPSGEWYGSKDLCIPGSLCRSSINLKSSWARVRSYGEKYHDDSPGSMYWDNLTVILSFSLCSFSLFGMTTVSLCTPQLRMTWAGVALYFAAILLTPSCSKKVDERPRKFDISKKKEVDDDAAGRNTKGRICNNQDSLLFAVLSQILLGQTWMYFNLVDSGYDLDMGEQDLQSLDRKVGYTDGFDFPCFEQFLHLPVRIDECWWFLWVEHARKGCISDCVWLVYETRAKWGRVTSMIRKTDLRPTLEASALDTDRYNRNLTLRATARKLHERGDGPHSWKSLR